MRNIFTIILIFTILFIINSCEVNPVSSFNYNNPYDPFSSNYNPNLILGKWEFNKNVGTYLAIYPGIDIATISNDNYIVLFGGSYYGFPTNLVSAIQITNDTTKLLDKKPLLKNRFWCSVTHLYNTYFIFGGDDEGTFEVYNFITDSTIILNSLPSITLNYGTVAFTDSNNIFLIGGESATGVKNNYVWLFNPYLLTWSIYDTLPEPLSFASAIKMNQKIFIIGGFNANNQASRKIYIYDLNTKQWDLFTKLLPDGVAKPILVPWDSENKIYCIGGIKEKDYFIKFTKKNYEIDLKNNIILEKKEGPEFIEFLYTGFWINKKIQVLGQAQYNLNFYNFKLQYF